MTKNELLKLIYKNILRYEKELEVELDAANADLISDFIIFDIEFKIAKFAIEHNHSAVIKGIPLQQLVEDEDIEDEDGLDIFASEYISNWISTTSGSIVYNFVQQSTPNAEILEIINYYETAILNYANN